MSNHGLLCLVLSAAGLTACGFEGEACIDVPEDGVCPASEDVDRDEAWAYFSCDGEKVLGVSGEGEKKNVSQTGGVLGCCYEARLLDTTPGSSCVVGRPLREASRDVLAEVVPRTP